MSPHEGITALYPYLELDGEGPPAGREAAPSPSPRDSDELEPQLVRSTAGKIAAVAALRREVVVREAERLSACARAMADRFVAGGRLLVFGNGGSATDCLAVASLYLEPPAGIALGCLSLAAEPAVLSALANDVGFDVAFARPLAALAREADVAMGISTSGNSENLCRAFEEASNRGLVTVGLAGYDGGRMADLQTIDHLFVVPSSSVHRVQEAQTTLLHALWSLVQGELAGSGSRP